MKVTRVTGETRARLEVRGAAIVIMDTNTQFWFLPSLENSKWDACVMGHV